MATAPVGVVLPPTAPAPPKQPDFLQKLGDWFKDKFNPAAKVVLQDATVVATAAEPVIDIAFPAIAGLYNTTLQMVTQAQAAASAAAAGADTGTQKMTAVVSALSPIAIPYLKSIGVAQPTVTQIQAYVQSVVDGLKVFAAETAPASTPVAVLPATPLPAA
jgi:hypothetical protein